MSHHPSSAELAAFRRAVRMPPSMNHSPLSRHRGAWTNERTDGIGNRNRPAWLSTADHSLARREASRMRSRAFSALVATGPWPIGHGYEDGSRVCPIERSNGLPVEIGHYA